MRNCKVFVHNVFAGILTERSANDYTFVYDDDYLNTPQCRPVCRMMPTNIKEYRSEVLFPYFFNMLSEGANRKMQSEILHLDRDDDFGILMETAQYDTPGAVTVEPINYN